MIRSRSQSAVLGLRRSSLVFRLFPISSIMFEKIKHCSFIRFEKSSLFSVSFPISSIRFEKIKHFYRFHPISNIRLQKTKPCTRSPSQSAVLGLGRSSLLLGLLPNQQYKFGDDQAMFSVSFPISSIRFEKIKPGSWSPSQSAVLCWRITSFILGHLPNQ